jgi:peptidoglycan hydrolase-like protein with peptidoglycan-binding domain
MAYITEKDAIQNLQRYLRQLSYTQDGITAPPIDGIYSDATRASLKSFQRKNGLKESGIADRETWDKLYAEYLSSVAIGTPPLSVPVFPRTPNGYELEMGDKYFAVSILQLLLNELRIIYDSFVPLAVTGIYDENTEANVIDFQEKNRLPITGKVNKETWDSLVNAYQNNAYDYVR